MIKFRLISATLIALYYALSAYAGEVDFKAERDINIGQIILSVQTQEGLEKLIEQVKSDGNATDAFESIRSDLTILLAELIAAGARDINEQALANFFRILKVRQIPRERIVVTLSEIAERHVNMLRRLDALHPEDPAVSDLIRSAREAIANSDYDDADDFLRKAEEAELAGVREAEQLAAEAEAAAVRRRRSAVAHRVERAEIARTQLDYLKSAEHFAQAARIAPQTDHKLLWVLQLRRATALNDLGNEFGISDALAEAIRVYRESVLPLAQRSKRPTDWATTNDGLGLALTRLGERQGDQEMLEEAVSALKDALSERKRDQQPFAWAATQTNLGYALWRLGQRGGGRNSLNQSVDALRRALEEQSPDQTPIEWSSSQHRLGNALASLGALESGTVRMEESILAYRKALSVRTEAHTPYDWAMTQNNLGLTYWELGVRSNNVDRIEQSLGPYELALRVFSQDRAPLSWAMVKNNLGLALMDLGKERKDATLLGQAVVAYRESLKERRRGRVPLGWAMTMNNVGVALHGIGRIERDLEKVQEAHSAYMTALEEWTPDRVPFRWALTKENLASLCLLMFDFTDYVSNLKTAMIHIEEALATYQNENAVHYVTKSNKLRTKISRALENVAEGGQAAGSAGSSELDAPRGSACQS